MTTIYYVYTHVRNDTGQIFYVGKGCGNRCFSKRNRNRHWHHIAKKTEYTTNIVIKNVAEEFAFLCEIELISKLRYLGIGLTNYTNGGEGFSGGKHKEDVKALLSELHRNNRYWVGKKHTQETKNKMSECKKGKQTWNANKRNVYSEETIKKMSKAKLGLFKTYIWWNDGVKNTRSEVCPGDGWVRGVVRKNKVHHE